MDISQRLLVSLYNSFLPTKSPIFPVGTVLSRQSCHLMYCILLSDITPDQARAKEEVGGCLLSAASSAAVVCASTRGDTFLYSLVVYFGQPGLLINCFVGYMPDPF